MDAIIEHYKRLVDRAALRANLKLTVDERLHRLQQLAAERPPARQPPSPDQPWRPVSDCGPGRISDPVIELYKRDIDRTLLRQNLMRTVDERCRALESMACLIEELQSQNRKIRVKS
jgi:hypothetical protein